MLAFLLFLLTRPYTGIKQDAQLYIGFALAKIDPTGIGRDLLFTADGQSGYSIFPPLLLEVVELVGPSAAAMTVVLVGLVLWYVALRHLVEHVFPVNWSAVQKNAGVVVAVALSSHYGGTGVFRFAEPYATPRVFAEALVIFAFALLLRGSKWFAGPIAVAFAVHPIMTAPGIGVAIWMKVKSARVRIGLFAASLFAVATVVVVSVQLDVHTGPLRRFDATWLEVLEFKRSLVFMRYWNPQDFARTVLHVATISVAWGCLRPMARQLASGIMVAVLFGTVATFIGADLVGNVLLSQAQLWRSMWLLALLATLCVPLVLYDAWGKASVHDAEPTRAIRKSATLLLLLGWVVAEISPSSAALAVVAAVLWHAGERWPALRFPPIGLPLVATVVGMLMVSVLCVQVWVATGVAWTSPDLTMRWNWNSWVVTGVPGALMLTGALGPLLRTRLLIPFAAPAFMSVAASVLVLAKGDSRTSYQKYLEHSLDGYIRNGTRLIPSDGSPVIWPHADIEAWAFAGSPSWGGITQGVPAVFSRDLSLQWYGRWLFLKGHGLIPGVESALAGPSRHLVKTCPKNESAIVVAVRSNDTRGTLLLVPKLVQPRQVGESWTQHSRIRATGCR